MDEVRDHKDGTADNEQPFISDICLEDVEERHGFYARVDHPGNAGHTVGRKRPRAGGDPGFNTPHIDGKERLTAHGRKAKQD
ncbi:hypothetical protein JMJ58_21380 (plasmid) [Haloterrigena salifodinae]|uniref:Uncharacterized protein n=1 Tax=Haloterrigena salifodinae TaxID=2675099 RepID=A0A8T8E704_9EURY|nr:hypothetical protein [Haloterrigena salifodinae]QRV17403.1 hypothetical protein JMJ58_21380 [Haloterrigena salifodinae]